VIINSSLNEIIPNLNVFGSYKIRIMYGCFANSFRSSGSMRPTKCDQEQVNQTLRSGARAKNEGKFGFSAVTRACHNCKLPSITPKVEEIEVCCVVSMNCRGYELKNPHN
jgi:hypothetical protein